MISCVVNSYALEVLQLSGIVTILFSAITLKRYCVHSIPHDVQHSVTFFFEVMAFIAETSVFIYLGFSVFAAVRRLTLRLVITLIRAMSIALASFFSPYCFVLSFVQLMCIQSFTL